MSNVYAIDHLPSDLLNSPVEGARRLKVEAVVLDPESTPESGLVQKDFTYNPNGSIATITETNLTTTVQIRKTFNYDVDGNLESIVPVIL